MEIDLILFTGTGNILLTSPGTERTSKSRSPESPSRHYSEFLSPKFRFRSSERGSHFEIARVCTCRTRAWIQKSFIHAGSTHLSREPRLFFTDCIVHVAALAAREGIDRHARAAKRDIEIRWNDDRDDRSRNNVA